MGDTVAIASEESQWASIAIDALSDMSDSGEFSYGRKHDYGEYTLSKLVKTTATVNNLPMVADGGQADAGSPVFP